MIRAPHVLALAGLFAAACGDNAGTSKLSETDAAADGAISDAAPVTDTAVTPPDGALPDAAIPDAAVPDAAVPDAAVPDAAVPDAALPDMNVVVPDAALPDAALPDAYAPTPLDAGAACQPDSPEGTCGPFSQCIDGICHADLSPGVYRMAVANVVEPATAAEALNGALSIALQANQINLLIEMSGYTADGYRVNVGNGRALVAGDPMSDYVFNHELPIQNVYGGWVNDHGAPRFEQDGQGIFSIFAPGRPVVTADGTHFMCWNEIATTVHVSVEPRQHDDGTVYVHAIAAGYMTQEDANAVVFYPFEGLTIPLSDTLVNEPLVDANLDGVADEYAFNIEIDAEAVVLNDLNPARSPDSVPEEPVECNQNP